MKTTVRIPEELAAEAQRRAEWLGLSLNGLIAVALDAYLGHDRVRERMPNPVQSGGKLAESVKGSPAALARIPGPGLSRQQRRQLERSKNKLSKGDES